MSAQLYSFPFLRNVPIVHISDNEYSLILGQSEELRLNVTVTNEQESAYEAQLFVEHQPSVTYIAASKGIVICNRFNETVVACTLGNPLRRYGSAQVMLRFDPSGLEDSEPRMQFQVFANSTSKQIEPRKKTVLTVNVVKKAELSIRGWALPEQSFYGGEIVGESGMEYLEDIGGSVQHTYQIYNDGPWRVPFLNVKILWPHQVANDKEKGKWLLYLEEKPLIEGDGGGECLPESVTHVNPLDLKHKPKAVNVHEPAELFDYRSFSMVGNKSQNYVGRSSEKNGDAVPSSKSTGSSTLNRVRRDRAVVIRAERLVDKDGKKHDIVNMVNFNGFKLRKRILMVYIGNGCFAGLQEKLGQMCAIELCHLQHAKQVGGLHPCEVEAMEFDVSRRLSARRSSENHFVCSYLHSGCVRYPADEAR